MEREKSNSDELDLFSCSRTRKEEDKEEKEGYKVETVQNLMQVLWRSSDGLQGVGALNLSYMRMSLGTGSGLFTK